MVLPVLPAFDNTGSAGYPLHLVVYLPSVPTLLPASHILAGNKETELKPINFFSLLLLCVFLPFLFSYPLCGIAP